jgi:hypothetical protein
MPTVEELALPATAAAPKVIDRRRDGRIDYSNPHLIDLLRRPTSVVTLPPAEPEIEIEPVIVMAPPASTLSAFPFIMLASLVFWGVVAVLLWKTMFR